MRILIVVPARAESSRFPGKLLLPIDRQPMIRYMVDHLVASTFKLEHDVRVIVATDSPTIAKAVETSPVTVQYTSMSCRNGTERVAEAVSGDEADIVLNVQADQLDVEVQVLEAAIRSLHEADLGTVVTSLPGANYGRILTDPNRVKTVLDWQGYCAHFFRLGALTRCNIYEHVGIYAYRLKALQAWKELPVHPMEEALQLEQVRPLYAGMKMKGVQIPRQICPIPIDTWDDYTHAQDFLKYREWRRHEPAIA